MPYLDDSSLHEQMTRFAASRIKEGHLPLTSWFPYLGLGSPQFLHYQSLPAMTAGVDRRGGQPRHGVPLVDVPVARAVAVAVYWCGRLFGLVAGPRPPPPPSLPSSSSGAGIGYETKAYVWVGYGVWTQLWASWTLPLAWGFTYRSLSVAARASSRPSSSSC